MDSTYTSANKASGTTRERVSEYEYDNGYDDDEDDDAESGTPRMRCILCTTAASWVQLRVHVALHASSLTV